METKIISLYKGEVKIKFIKKMIGEKEIHWFEHLDGRKIDGVTSISGLLDKSAAMAGWAAKMVALYMIQNWDIKKIKTEGEKLALIERAKREYRRISMEAANIGKDVHRLAEDWIKGREVVLPDNEKVVNGYTAFLKWIRDNKKLRIKNSEKIVYSRKYDYAGIMDWDGTEGKELIMGDFKTSNGIYNNMFYQVAAYWQAREEELGIEYSKGYIVQFEKETGNFDSDKNVSEILRQEYKKNFKAFLGLRRTKTRENELKKIWKQKNNNY